MSSQQTKRLDIQLLRALAVVLVVVFHFSLWDTRGWLGVDVFFVISGYVITSSIIRRDGELPPFRSSVAFVYRRARRLTPALIFMIAGTTFFSGILQSAYDLLPITIWTAISAAFGLGNVAVALQSGDYFSPKAEWNPLLHTWSLGVEEQFYLLFAVLLSIGLFRRSRDSIRGLTILAVLSLASLAAFLFGSLGYATEGFQTLLGFYSPVTRAWELGAGVILAMLARRSQKSFRATGSISANLISGISIFAIALLALTPGDPNQTRHLDTLMVVLLTAVTIHFGLNNKDLSTASYRPLIWVGNYSYSAYLWHWPIWVLTGSVIQHESTHLSMALFLTLLMTWVSGKFVEPMLDKRELVTRQRRVELAVFTLITIALASLPSLRAFSFPFPPSQFQGTSDFSKSIPCDTTDDLLIRPCLLDFGHQRTLLVVGDSTSVAYFWQAAALAQSRELNLVFSSKDGCPATRPGLRYPRTSDCVNWQQSVYESIKILGPEEVWIINRSAAYTTPSMGFYGLVDDEGKIITNNEEIRREWREGLEYVLSASENSNFIIFENAPEVKLEPDSRTLFNAWRGFEAPLAEIDRAQSQEARGVASSAHKDLETGSVQILDPYEALCFESVCKLRSELGLLLYADGAHLSPLGAELVIRAWLHD